MPNGHLWQNYQTLKKGSMQIRHRLWRKFLPEYAGKMNFYLNAVDDLLRHPDDKLSIGLVLCQDKNRLAPRSIENHAGFHPPMRHFLIFFH